MADDNAQKPADQNVNPMNTENKTDNSAQEQNPQQDQSAAGVAEQKVEPDQNSESIETKEVVNQESDNQEETPNKEEQQQESQSDNSDKKKPETTQQERNLAGLGYIPLLAFISITLKPDSKYCTFHGNQGVVITILWFLVVFWLMIAGIFDPSILGSTLAITGSLAFLGVFGLNIISLYKGYIGEMWEIPILGAIAKKMNFGKTIKEVAGVENQNNPQKQDEVSSENKEANSENDKSVTTDSSTSEPNNTESSDSQKSQ